MKNRIAEEYKFTKNAFENMYGCSIYVHPIDSTACLLLEDSISVQYRMSSLDNGLSNSPSENNFDLLMN